MKKEKKVLKLAFLVKQIELLTVENMKNLREKLIPIKLEFLVLWLKLLVKKNMVCLNVLQKSLEPEEESKFVKL